MSRLEMFLRELKLTPKKVIRLSTIDNNLNILSRELESFFIKHNDDTNKEAVIRVFYLNFVRTLKINDRNIETINTDNNIRDMIRQLYEDSNGFMNEAAGVINPLTPAQKRKAITNYNKLSNMFIKEGRGIKDIQPEIKKSRSRRKEKLQEEIQEARQEARQELVEAQITEDQITRGAEDEITRGAEDQITEQADEQRAINNMDIGDISYIEDDNGDIVATQVEIDLGCNEVEDQDEDDENQDNEICNIIPKVQPQGQPQITPGVFTVDDFNNAKLVFTQQDNSVIRGQNIRDTLSQRINSLLSKSIKRIGSRSQRTTQTIESRIFDTVHELYGQGNLKAEVKNNTLFKGENQQYNVITIYKTTNLFKRIENTFNEYVYNVIENTPITLDDTDILIVLLYGVKKFIIKQGDIKYKVEIPKPKLKRVAVGGDNTEKIDKTIGCYNNTNERSCGLYALLTTLYGLLNRSDDLIKSVILWFDTHHDFKEDRYDKAKTVWNAAFGGETFITWYAKKFFTPNPPNNDINQYSFSIEATNNTNVLTPVVNFSNRLQINGILNRTAIPTLLYNISQKYLQNRLFEKTVLLHYIVHNFEVPTNNSTTLLRDILYVHRNTYNNLLAGIQSQVNEINNGNDPQKLKKFTGVALKLKQLNKLYGAINNDNIFNNITDFTGINQLITNMLAINPPNPPPTFSFVDTDNPLPNFTSNPDNTRYVVDVNKRNELFTNNKVLQYVPSALFDSNGGNTYEPDNISDTAYDEFIDINPGVVPNTPLPSSYNIGGVNHLENNYKYGRNGCKLEVVQNNPLNNNQVNTVLTKADIRCSTRAALEDNFTTPDAAKNISYVKGYLTQQLRYVPDNVFINRMYKVLLKFVRPGNIFAIQKNRNNTYSLTLPKFFNNVRDGPGIQDLVFLTILYRLEGRDNLQLVDNIVNLKRVGDYGQVKDAKMANLPFFTTDNMETLMCIIEKVSCYIDFNQGVIIYDNNGGGVDGGFIRSKSKSGDAFTQPQVPPGYGRRTLNNF